MLQVSYTASADEIKRVSSAHIPPPPAPGPAGWPLWQTVLWTAQAYRELARRHHPDKGGDAAAFAAVQDAFETLSSRTRRAVYDEWAREVQFRHIPARTHQALLLFLPTDRPGFPTPSSRV